MNDPNDPPSRADLERLAEILARLAADPSPLSAIDADLRQRLLTAAGQLTRPDTVSRRRLARAFRKRDRDEVRRHDEDLLQRTGMRALRQAPVYPTPLPLTPAAIPTLDEPGAADSSPAMLLQEARKCYVCKQEYRQIHVFYDQLCPSCAELNWTKRHQTADLNGRTALVTGARVKIGYHASILLLRAGARVIATTRFPVDAAQRYAREPDFEQWCDRLVIHGLDLRHSPSVERLCRHLLAHENRLDFILNNACQTVRRPAGFYAHLIEGEMQAAALPRMTQGLLAAVATDAPPDPSSKTISTTEVEIAAVPRGIESALASQVALLREDLQRGPEIFPHGELDADLQQVDLRDRNSWRLSLAEVSAVELLEVHLVNAVAPFLLNARLKPLMLRYPSLDKHIVNVSAMEGQFYREFKTDKHPHTNMAKAALNMMTRTSAADYVRDGIHMNSVDTGWITDEDPAVLAERKRTEHRFSPPLDVVDGAARIVDPIFSGFLSGEHVWGLFLKDYKPTPW